MNWSGNALRFCIHCGHRLSALDKTDRCFGCKDISGAPKCCRQCGNALVGMECTQHGILITQETISDDQENRSPDGMGTGDDEQTGERPCDVGSRPSLVEDETFLALVARAVTSVTAVTIDQMRSKTRARANVQARELFVYVVRKHKQISYPDIGTFLRKNHTTMIRNIRKIMCDDSLRRSALVQKVERVLAKELTQSPVSKSPVRIAQ